MTHKSFDRRIQRQVIRGHTTSNSTHRSGCGYQQGKDCSSTAQCYLGMSRASMQSMTLLRCRCMYRLSKVCKQEEREKEWLRYLGSMYNINQSC